MRNTYQKLAAAEHTAHKIKQNQPFPSKYLTPFSLCTNEPNKYRQIEDSDLGFIEPSEDSDLFCYAMMILNYLYGESVSSQNIEQFYEYLNYLHDIGINQELIDSFADLVISKPNINQQHLIDSLTRENVCRARKVVYQKVKEKKIKTA